MTRLRTKKKKMNVVYLIICLIVVVLTLFSAAYYYLSNGVTTSPFSFDGISEEGPSFTLTTTKNDLNQFLKQYIETEALQKDNIDYSVRLHEVVSLEGSITTLSTRVPFVLTFEPEVLANGDLLLKQKKFNVAKVNLPVQILMQLISRTYSFPDGVLILPDQRSIYLSLTSINAKGKFKVRAEQFDLVNDHIQFKVYYRPNQ
jgi:uncharacterized protein YpmS